MSNEKEPLSIYHLLMVMVEQTAGVAWQKMGLQHDPITGQIEKDLDEAKVAIDVAAMLSEQLEPKLEDDDKRRIHSLVRDLRLNFVEKSKEPR